MEKITNCCECGEYRNIETTDGEFLNCCLANNLEIEDMDEWGADCPYAMEVD